MKRAMTVLALACAGVMGLAVMMGADGAAGSGDGRHPAEKDLKMVSLFDGKSLDGWTAIPANSWEVKDGALASLGKGRGVLYTKDDFARYRIIFTMRHLPANGGKDHQACVLFFCQRPAEGTKGLDALGGLQFQVPNGGHWDYRKGHNDGGKGEFTNAQHKKFNVGEWSRVELLVDSEKGTAKMAVAQPPGTKAEEVGTFDVKNSGVAGPFALQMHNGGLFDEYKDIYVEVDPKGDELVTTK